MPMAAKSYRPLSAAHLPQDPQLAHQGHSSRYSKCNERGPPAKGIRQATTDEWAQDRANLHRWVVQQYMVQKGVTSASRVHACL
jgi:hypothetical protein